MTNQTPAVAALQAENAALHRRIAEQDQAMATLQASLEEAIAERTAALRQSEQVLREVLNNIPAVIYAKDRAGRYVFSNRLYAGLLGRPPDEVVGQTDYDLRPDEADEWRANDREILQSGQSIDVEEQAELPDGQHIYQVSKFPLYDTDGKVFGTGGIATDVTQLKVAERDVRNFRTLVERAPDGIALMNTEQTIVYANDAYNRMLGYDTSVNVKLSTVTAQGEEHRLAEIQNRMRDGETWQGRYQHQRRDQSTFTSHLSLFPIVTSEGETTAIGGIMRDMSDQLRAEEERATLQQQVIDAQRDALRELSTPLIPVSDEVVIMPLIGTIDSQRAQQVMETLLEGVARHQSSLVILDITGVAVVDTQVAQNFIQAAQAVRLLGAQVMLTGIQPQIAQTLVHLGVDLSGIQTRGSLQSGIAAALKQHTAAPDHRNGSRAHEHQPNGERPGTGL